jgi:CheY-like chemotaxis protein
MNRLRPILVVEDSDEDFATVLDAAKRSGVTNEIRRVTSGEACLQLLRASKENKNTVPSLILLDLNTPSDDGRDALREIKQDERLRALPLVVLSTSANPRDLAFCYASGANAYHVKPVNHLLHLQVLEQIFDYWLTSIVFPT